MKRENFHRSLLGLVLPIALQNLLSAIVSASDALMLGMVNQESLSAVSLATQVQFVFNLFQAALVIGTTVLASQYWGKKDTEAVEDVLMIALRLSILISAVFFLGAFLCPRFLMQIFSNEEELIQLGIPYLRIVSFSYLFMGTSQIYLCIMKNSGRTLRSTLYASSAVVINFVLNAVLILGLGGFPKLEIRGAAIATVIARAIELSLVFGENCRRDVVKIRWTEFFHVNAMLQKDFFRYTTPVFLNEMAWGCGFTMFTVIMGHLGNDAVAANSIANIVKNIIACVCLGIGTGSGILVGNELGRGNLEKARIYGGKLCRLAIVAGAISGALIVVLIPLILQVSTNLTDTATGYLKVMLCICGYYMIGKSVNSTVIAGIFCAGGDTKFGFCCDAITMWLFCVPLGACAAFVFKMPVLVVYFLLNLDEIVKLPAVYYHYKKYRWVKNLTKKEELTI